MFFFYINENLDDNYIVQEAFQNQCFNRLIESGYCDMNIYLGKATEKRETIAYNLELRNSPLAILFKKVQAKNTEEAAEKLGVVLEKMVLEQSVIDDYVEFAIIYYIYKSISTSERKQEFTREILRSWQENLPIDRWARAEEMDLRISHGIIFDNNTIELQVINTITQYISFLGSIKQKNDKLFFRGHSDISYKLIPSIFRDNEWLQNEKLMYQELQINCSSELGEMKGHLETLAEMQHYGLPTRLLDITRNPLVALYFACEGINSKCGEVIVFGIDRENIKYPQSDTVAVLSSIPLFTYSEQKEFYKWSRDKMMNSKLFNQKIERLIQEVRIERPGFIGKIRPEDLRKSIVIIPARNNRRLEKQEGAFIICGLLDEMYGQARNNSIEALRVRGDDGKKVVCVIARKAKLLKQLNSLGINKSKIYPEIDDVADYIKNNVKLL